MNFQKNTNRVCLKNQPESYSLVYKRLTLSINLILVNIFRIFIKVQNSVTMRFTATIILATFIILPFLAFSQGQNLGDEASTFALGFGADRFELRAVGAETRLTATILGDVTYNLDNDPPSLTGVDINAAMQWDRIQAGIGNTVSFSGQASIVPEPSTFALLGMVGIAGCFVRRRRK